MATVAVGDILVNARGSYRTVRRVSRCSNGDLRCCTFAIMRKSWTNRPETTLNATDLRLQGYRPVGLANPMSTQLDKELAKDLRDPNRRKLKAYDVIGVLQ